jgi:hypothetical protein
MAFSRLASHLENACLRLVARQRNNVNGRRSDCQGNVHRIRVAFWTSEDEPGFRRAIKWKKVWLAMDKYRRQGRRLSRMFFNGPARRKNPVTRYMLLLNKPENVMYAIRYPTDSAHGGFMISR